MVNGVNSNYYNYYNNYQNQYGSYGVQQPSFTATAPIITANNNPINLQQAEVKTAGDGKDDGHISFLSKVKNLVKGGVKFVTGMFTDENGNFSLGQTLKSLAIAVGVGATCVLTAGTAVPAILAATGVAISGIGVAKAGIQAAMAETDAEAEQAWQSLGSNGVALGLSVAGAKAVAKANAAAAGESVEQFAGIKGTGNAVKYVFKESVQPAKNAIAGVKDSYIGATTLDKVKNAASHVKDNVVKQSGEFYNTVKGNYTETIYGTSSKVAAEADKLSQQKTAIQDKMSQIADKTSKKYKTLENKVKTIEAKEAAMREINATNSASEAAAKIEANKSILSAKQEQLKTATADADKAALKAEIAELKTKISTQENVLLRRSSEINAIDKRIAALTDKMNKEGVSASKQAEYQAEIAELNARKIAANFTVEEGVNVKPDSYYTYAGKEIYRSSINELTKGNLKNNIRNFENPTQWLTAGILGRQFGETTEYQLYNQLSPQEQAYYKKLPYAQKLAIINRFEQVS